MLEETQDHEEIVARIAALDIGKAELVCCARVPGPGRAGTRMQEVGTYSTMTRSLLRMADRLAELGVTRVVMEATSDYWKPPFYLLEAAGFETWLVNAKDVRHLPGRPKTDLLTELRDVAAGHRAASLHQPAHRGGRNTVSIRCGAVTWGLGPTESGHSGLNRWPSSLLVAAPRHQPSRP